MQSLVSVNILQPVQSRLEIVQDASHIQVIVHVILKIPYQITGRIPEDNGPLDPQANNILLAIVLRALSVQSDPCVCLS